MLNLAYAFILCKEWCSDGFIISIMTSNKMEHSSAMTNLTVSVQLIYSLHFCCLRLCAHIPLKCCSALSLSEKKQCIKLLHTVVRTCLNDEYIYFCRSSEHCWLKERGMI